MPIKISLSYRCATCLSEGRLENTDSVWKCPRCKSTNVTVKMEHTVHEVFFGPNVQEVAGDSDVCAYCSRSVFPIHGDEAFCKTCANYDNFIGVNCTAIRSE